MPKILRIINRFNLGGPTFNAALLTKYLAPEFETLLIGGVHEATEDTSSFIVEDLGIQPTVIPEMQRAINWKKDNAAYRKILDIIAGFKPDVVHTHASKAGAIGRLAAHKMKVPVVVHTFHGHVFHSYFGNAKTTLYKKAERYLAKRSDAIIAISDLQKTELVEKYRICPPDKMHVIHLGFDLERFRRNKAEKRAAFRNQYRMDADTVAIIITGRLVPIKNHALFLDVMKNVMAKSPVKVRAFIVGDGMLRAEIEAKAQALGLSCSGNDQDQVDITFTSWIRDIDRALAGSDIVMLTSNNEGTPVTLIEAQAAEKPIVTTDVGGIRDIVLTDETAFVCPPGDTEALTAATLKLLEEPELYKKMSLKGWEFVSEKFHYTRLCENMSALYHKLLEARI